MTGYRDYTLELVLQSSVVTPFQSDTIFGHICWAVRFLKWDIQDKLEHFLRQFGDSNSPPLLVSNGFPKGYLAKPILTPVTQKELDSLLGRSKRIHDSFKVKAVKNADLIEIEQLGVLVREQITPLKLFESIYKMSDADSCKMEEVKGHAAIVQHNTINRLENRVKSGLYSHEELFFDEESRRFEIYLRTNYFSKDDLVRIFEFVGEQGYGKDKSTGKGYFTFMIRDGIDLPESAEPNAFMTLSSYIPAHHDPVRGHYSIILKYGKLGGFYGSGVAGKVPFKKPLIMFSAGSTFYTEDFKKADSYGVLLEGVHHDRRIRHYAYAFPLGIRL